MKKISYLLMVAMLASLASLVLGMPVEVRVSGEGSTDLIARELVKQSSGGQVTLRLIFDDGQIIDVTGNKADAQDYLANRITEDDFLVKLEYGQVTRGPIMQPGECNTSKGDNCLRTGACACYTSQTCKPGDSRADIKGCFDELPPRNAQRIGSEYACNEGFIWNGNMTDCVEKTECPGNTVELEGKCYEKENSTGCCGPALPAILALISSLFLGLPYALKK